MTTKKKPARKPVPKPEVMWMWWCIYTGFNPVIWGASRQQCWSNAMHYGLSSNVGRPVRVRITPVRSKQ